MNIKEKLLQSILPGKIVAVQIGISRTVVVAETEFGLRGGLAASLSDPCCNTSVRGAGRLESLPATELAGYITSENPTEAAVGMAAINALLPQDPSGWLEGNAAEYITQAGAGRNVAVVGHFPFVDALRSQVKNLWVLELKPREDDLPAAAAPQVIPQADMIVITATALINRTFDSLAALCRPDARLMLVGPSAPLSPLMFDVGIDFIGGSVVMDPMRTLKGIGQGITLQELRQSGAVKYINIQRDASRQG